MWILEFMRKKLASLILGGLVFAAIGFMLLVWMSPRAEVQTDYLVTQGDTSGKDFYTLARSSDYIGKILNEVMYSDRFIGEVIATGKVSAESLPFEKRNQLKEWRRTVKVEREADLGILRVTVLHDDSREAQKISQAISQVLIEKNSIFLGTGDQNVPVSILSGPLAEWNPNVGEIVSVVLSGFFFGSIVVFIILFLREEKKKKSQKELFFIDDALMS
jgi:capsular polysaccharide biosynthesis protein